MKTHTVNVSTQKVVDPESISTPSLERPTIDTAVDSILRFRFVTPDNSPWAIPANIPVTAKVWNRKGTLAFDIGSEASRVVDGQNGLIMISVPPGGAPLSTSSRASLDVLIADRLVLKDSVNVLHSAFPEQPVPSPSPWPAPMSTRYMPWAGAKEYIDTGLAPKVTREEMHQAIQAALGSSELSGLSSRPMALEYMPIPGVGWYDLLVLYYGPTNPGLNHVNGHLYRCTSPSSQHYVWTDVTPESWLVGQWIVYED